MNSPSWKKSLYITIPPLDLRLLQPLDQEANGAEAPHQPVKPPKRCMGSECKVRLGLTAFACRCGGYYCGAHRADDAHACGYDYRAEQRMYLSSQMVKMEAKKIDVI